MTNEKGVQKFSKIQVPHTCVIIFAIIVFCALLTYVIPAGQYKYITGENGVKLVDPSSFTAVAPSPTTITQLFNAIPLGLVKMAALIFFVFVAGGTFAIINGTGTIAVAINRIALHLEGREKLMIFVIMFIFSLLGAFMGFSTECILFIPIGVALARRVGYDSMVGTGMILMGAFVGFSSGAFNPYTTAVAQGIVGLPLFSGLGLRLAMHAVTLVIASLYIIRYAERVKRDPKASYVYELELGSVNENIDEQVSNTHLNISHILVLLTMMCGFTMIIYGALYLKWSTSQMMPVFFGMGIISGILGRMTPNKIAETWLFGARTMVFAALVIGMGRGVLIVMEDAKILDTVIHQMAIFLQWLPPSMVAIGMLVCNIFINFFVPSGSGQATLVMPIMGPLGQICGVSAQTSVLAFQFGDGFTNATIPTSSVTNACIGVAGINFVQWLRFAFPLVAIEWGISAVFIIIAGYIGY